MRKGIGYGLLGLSYLLQTACGDARQDRTLPDLEITDGVEVATLPALPALLDPEHRWTFHVERQIRTVADGLATPLVFDPGAALLLSDGKLLVHDPSADQPLVILSIDEGPAAVVARFGTKGAGPGELGSYLVLAEIDDGIIALDGMNRQVHRFTRTGQSISSVRVPFESTATRALVGPVGDGFLVEGLVSTDDGWHRKLDRLDMDSGAETSFVRLPDPEPSAEIGRIQRGRVLWAVVGDHIVSMFSGRPEIQIHDREGRLERRIRLPFSQRSITERELSEQVQEFGPFVRGIFARGAVAYTNDLLALNDSVFATLASQIFRAAEEESLPAGELWWRLMTVHGEYLGAVQRPDDLRPLGTSDRGFWARVLDDVGNPILQELSLVRDERGP